MFIAIFITSIVTCIIVLVIIYFPYKKVADLLSKFIHVRTMFTGIFFVIAGLITISVSDTATNDMAGFLSNYPKVVGGAATGFGFIYIIASFLINHLFGSEEERSNTQDAAEQAKVKGLTK
ncbi:TPA: hypothetical protein RJ074_004298 [Escherichia coli]|nr:hypothetical protein [Escherichia coli]